MVVGFVCEGVTDVPALQAVVDAVLGTDYEPRFIQPDRDALSARTGWAEVKKWCEQSGAILPDFLTWTGIDLLIIHLDADIRQQVKANTTTELCAKVKGWLSHGANEPRLLIVIPAQAIEAWLLAAHVAASPELERHAYPARLLVSHRLVDGSADGKPIKDRAKYEELASKLTRRVADLRPVLSELNRFACKLEAVAARLGRPVVLPAGTAKPKHRSKRRA